MAEHQAEMLKSRSGPGTSVAAAAAPSTAATEKMTATIARRVVGCLFFGDIAATNKTLSRIDGYVTVWLNFVMDFY